MQFPVMDVDKVQALEQHIAKAGTPLLELMKRAGTALANAAKEQVAPGAALAILAGSGNNGGDGWVAAHALASEGFAVTLITRTPASQITSEPARTAALQATESTLFSIIEDPSADQLHAVLSNADLIIDAILGTGFTHESVREPYAMWIDQANAAHSEGKPIISADCPSGLNAQTGNPATSCIHADETITMLVCKPGLLAPTASSYVGSLNVAPLGDFL